MGLVCGLWCDKYPTDEHMKCLVGFSYFKTHCLPLDFVASVSLQMKTVVCVCAPMYIVRLEICVAIAKKSMDTPATEVSHMFSPGWCSGYNATSAVGASITMPGGRGGVSSSNKVFSC